VSCSSLIAVELMSTPINAAWLFLTNLTRISPLGGAVGPALPTS